jgi:hypothetical protein
MDQVTTDVIATYLEKLKTIYLSIDKSKFKKELLELDEAIERVRSMPHSTTGPTQQNLPAAATSSSSSKKKTRKPNAFDHNLILLQEEKYDELKGTKINYKEVTTSVDVIEFLQVHTDAQILKNTTALDLKLLYCIMIDEETELKDKNKEGLLKSIKRNIRAGKRGEAFVKTI